MRLSDAETTQYLCRILFKLDLASAKEIKISYMRYCASQKKLRNAS